MYACLLQIRQKYLYTKSGFTGGGEGVEGVNKDIGGQARKEARKKNETKIVEKRRRDKAWKKKSTISFGSSDS